MENEIEKRHVLKKVLRSFVELLFLVLFVWAFFWFGGKKLFEDKIHQFINKANQNKAEEASLPAKNDPVEKKYQWEYGGQAYSLKKTLFGSFYNFYASLPKTYSYSSNDLPANWEEEYFGMFLGHPAEDMTIAELTAQLKRMGQEKKLTDDQLVEFVLSFVQNIPYDEAKAKQILSESYLDQSENVQSAPNYPYEVLYNNTGVCSDKSLLAYSLIKELGYGMAFFIYDKENHMAIGIKCPEKYSTYGSGYCYAETTNPKNKIGFIPELNAENNVASSAKELALFGGDSNQDSNLKTIGDAKILNKSDGKTYNGIIKSLATQQKIEDLKSFLAKEKKLLNALQANLKKNQDEIMEMKKEMEKLLNKKDYIKYNSLVSEYNDKLEDYQKELKEYNNRVKNYNQQVAEYNVLIKSFYQI